MILLHLLPFYFQHYLDETRSKCSKLEVNSIIYYAIYNFNYIWLYMVNILLTLLSNPRLAVKSKS